MTEDKGAAQRSLLCLPLGEVYFGLPLDNIIETVRDVQITAVPCLPPCYCGVCNRKGTITPVVRLDRLVGVPDEAAAEHPVTVMVRDRNYECGLLTAGRPVLLRVSDDCQLREDSDGVSGGTCRLAAIYRTEAGVVMELDLAATLESLVVCP